MEVGDAVYYTSAAAFCDRVQDILVPYDIKLVKQQLIQCLKGEAAIWYSQELDVTDKMSIRDDTSLNLIQFCTKLKNCFRVNKLEALDKFYGSIYGPKDAQAGRHLREFLSTKTLQGREADMPIEQLPMLIHNLIDPVFRLNMMTVTESTKMSDYRLHCEEKGDLFIKSFRVALTATPGYTQRRGFGSTMAQPLYPAILPNVRGYNRPAV